MPKPRIVGDSDVGILEATDLVVGDLETGDLAIPIYLDALAELVQGCGIPEPTLLDMLCGTVVGAAIRDGETRDEFTARMGVSYDQLQAALQSAAH